MSSWNPDQVLLILKALSTSVLMRPNFVKVRGEAEIVC